MNRDFPPNDEHDDVWTLAQGEINGQRVVLRRKHVTPDATRPVKVTVKIGFTDPRDDGFPGPLDEDLLGEAEEQLITELASHGAELVLVVTANYAREFVAYSGAHEWLEQWGPTVIDRWGQGRPGTGLDAVLEADWETFRFLSAE